MGDCLQAGKLSHYVTSHSGLPSLLGRNMSTSYSWEGKGRYGSFPIADERVGVQVKLSVRSLENTCNT